MKLTNQALLGALVALAVQGWAAAATCDSPNNIPLTRPDSRYEAVEGSDPVGGEVRDTVTGLIWQRCVQGMVWDGNTCTGTASTHTWQQALELARTAEPSSAATGASATWRLPSHAELSSLAELACTNPAINITWFPATPISPSWTWSSSPNGGSHGYAWGIDFFDGYVDYFVRSDANGVRLVRSGQ